MGLCLELPYEKSAELHRDGPNFSNPENSLSPVDWGLGCVKPVAKGFMG